MRHDYIVVVADGTRARFFTLVPATHPEVDSGPRLVEHDDLVNIVDDHRERHEAEYARRFAAEIMGRAVDLAQKNHVEHLVLAAEKHMLGLLRKTLKLPARLGIEVHELARDLVTLSPAVLHEHIAAAGLMPGVRPATAR